MMRLARDRCKALRRLLLLLLEGACEVMAREFSIKALVLRRLRGGEGSRLVLLIADDRWSGEVAAASPILLILCRLRSGLMLLLLLAARVLWYMGVWEESVT